ncbi:MAG: metal-dependent transcriptional regulator [Cyclobacteriaceae bacterium]|nr:metal-dependent transcriptional regulator [Cyclobacteriaceae bacterium]
MSTELSFTEENYLKAIYHLSAGGEKAVQTNEIAEAVSTRAASATDMIKKLSTKDLLHHEKYYGVTITSRGKHHALHVIRKHRLWETFLVHKLGFTWDEVHEVAEQLEHIKSDLLISKLDEFLGFPKEDPHGDPIPDGKGRFKVAPQKSLDQLAVGYQGVIVSVKDTDATLLKFLDKIGARPGKKIKVLDREAYDQSVEIMINNRPVFVSKEVSQNILVAV